MIYYSFITFVSQILPDFPLAKDINIASNYELVRKPEPFVYDHTANFTKFKDGVKSTVDAYLPGLLEGMELNQITLFFTDYFGVEY